MESMIGKKASILLKGDWYTDFSGMGIKAISSHSEANEPLLLGYYDNGFIYHSNGYTRPESLTIVEYPCQETLKKDKDEAAFIEWLEEEHAGHDINDHTNLSDYESWIDGLRVAFIAGLNK